MPRGTNEERAPEPIHQALRSEIRSKETRVESISRYQFMDCEQTVKVLIPLEKVGELSEQSITSEFTTHSFTLSIQNYKPDVVLKLVANGLEGKVVPEDCRHVQKENKVVVVLKKAQEDDKKCIPWRNLKN
eukprot:g671.t1